MIKSLLYSVMGIVNVIEGISEGRDITGTYRYTRVYYPEKDNWQIVSSQFHPIKN